MDSSSANRSSSSNNNIEEDDNNNDDSSNHPFHVFSPPPPPQSLWNFISPPPPPPPPQPASLSPQPSSHAGVGCNTTNDTSALDLTLNHSPCNRPSGRGGRRSSMNHHHPYAPGSASKSNQRRKTEHLMVAAMAAASSSSQPSSPSPPCTECGRRFPSSKALFGHMRCHPERAWRGINPPSNVRRTAPPTSGTADGEEATQDELDVAKALLLLSSGVFLKQKKTSRRSGGAQTSAAWFPRGGTKGEPADTGGLGRSNDRASDEQHGQDPRTSNGHGEGNDRSAGTSGGQQTPGSLQAGVRGGGQISSSPSSRWYIPDLNLPLPSPEKLESGNGS